MYTVFSDPHIGVNRKSHTTKDSRKKLAENIYKWAAIVSRFPNAICAGDLFDTYSNPEDVIIQGGNIVSNCHAVLAGNHDLSSRLDKSGSLQLLKETANHNNIAFASLGEVSVIYDDELPVAYIPHHSTQELFDKAIDTFCETGNEVESVFLHCNYDNAMAEGSDTSLNITPRQVDRLLELASFVFMGHEHNPRRLHGGRLIITGNTHPTSFSDISDKYIWGVADGEVEKELVWGMDGGYREIKWEAGMPAPDLTDVQFVDITGATDRSHRVELAKFVVDIWKSSDTLLMVRNNVELLSADADKSTRVDFANLPSAISKQVAGRDIEQLWRKYSYAELADN